MSLTGHLRDPGSPVRRWLAERLPHTAPVAREANHELRGPPGERNGRIITLGRPSHAPLASTARNSPLAGTALDLLTRATLKPGALCRSAAELGAGSIVVGCGIPPAMEIEREAVGRIDALGPWRGDLRADDWCRVAELCLLLACFEQAARSMAAIQYVTERVRHVPSTLDGYRNALVDDVDVDDVAAVAPATAADHADLRAAREVECGPVFALSSALGGADADVIADGLLLDFKATSTASIVKRAELWQLVGYALADVDDQYGIDAVGVGALRWRRRWTMKLGALLERLAGGPVDIETTREQFAQVVRARPPR